MAERDPLETLSAFLDGEEADAKLLAEALAAPGGREALLDFARLRAEIQEDASEPRPRFYDAMGTVLGGRRARRPWWTALVPMPAPALAALVLAVVGLGIWSGLDLGRGPRALPEEPPTPVRVIQLERDASPELPAAPLTSSTSTRNKRGETRCNRSC